MGNEYPPRGMACFSERAAKRLAELRARKLELLNTLTAEEIEELRWMEDYLQTRQKDSPRRQGDQ